MRMEVRSSQSSFQVTEPCGLSWTLELDRELTPDDVLRFRLPNSWSLLSGPSFSRPFQCERPEDAHYLSVTAPETAGISFRISIDPIPLEGMKGPQRHPRLISARLDAGRVPAGDPIRIGCAHTMAPYIADREEVWIRVNETAPETPPVLTVRGGAPVRWRLLVPSSVHPGEPFEALLVALDQFDNVADAVCEGERLLLEDGTVMAEDLSFRGWLRVPCRLEAPGVSRLRFREISSNPIRVDAKARGPYWGDLHIHTRLSHDAQGGDPYRYARDVSGLEFAAACDHWESLGTEGYRTLADWAAGAYEPGRFVALLADERSSVELTGHHNVYFPGETVPERYQAVPRPYEEQPPNSFARLAGAAPDELMVVPHHTGIGWYETYRGGRGSAVDWDATEDRGLRPLVEIYSHHGQSERYAPGHVLSYELNRMRNPERRSNVSVPGPYYVQDYWTSGRRVGVIASSDEHSGQGGRDHGGVAAVFAEELTRAGVFDALRSRRCYATTGERILLDFEVDGLPMGVEGARSPGARLVLRLRVWGTEILLRVDILRHRFGVDTGFLPVYSASPRPERRDVEVEIEEEFTGPCLYYARILQEPLACPGMAWSSPVWVDCESACGTGGHSHETIA